MAQLVTLEQFQASRRHYHISRIQSSELDRQTHYHDYFQVCFATCGEILHCQEGEAVSLGAGDAFIVPPGFVHSLHFNHTCSEVYSLAFEESLFHAGFSQSNAYQFLSGLRTGSGQSVRLRLVLDEGQRRSIHSLMECLLLQQETEGSPELSAAPSLISSVLYLLAQSYYQQPQNVDRLDELVHYNSALLQCTRYIDRNYRQPISLTALAKQFGLSRSAFCAVFPQFTGLSLRRYIAQKRIQEAQMRIRSNPELALGEIAMAVGYEDASTFYRNFLRESGMSPSKYRELCVNGK